MTPEQIEQAADRLVEARRTRVPIADLPAACRPGSVDDAYAIQDAVAARLGPVGGWKVGAPSPDGERRAAPMAAAGIKRAPAVFAAADFNIRGIECEIAFRLGMNLPPRGAVYTDADVATAVASAHAAIEIIDSRFVDRTAVSAETALADANSHGAFVYGPAVRDWQRHTFSRLPMRLIVDSTVAVETVGGNPAGDPLPLLVWLANHCAERGNGLRSGQFITTGSCTGLRLVGPGTTVRAEILGLGEAEARFTA